MNRSHRKYFMNYIFFLFVLNFATGFCNRVAEHNDIHPFLSKSTLNIDEVELEKEENKIFDTEKIIYYGINKSGDLVFSIFGEILIRSRNDDSIISFDGSNFTIHDSSERNVTIRETSSGIDCEIKRFDPKIKSKLIKGTYKCGDIKLNKSNGSIIQSDSLEEDHVMVLIKDKYYKCDLLKENTFDSPFLDGDKISIAFSLENVEEGFINLKIKYAHDCASVSIKTQYYSSECNAKYKSSVLIKKKDEGRIVFRIKGNEIEVCAEKTIFIAVDEVSGDIFEIEYDCISDILVDRIRENSKYSIFAIRVYNNTFQYSLLTPYISSVIKSGAKILSSKMCQL